MFDFAWSELMVIGVVALVVIGPKDLPKALKTAGFVVRRARSMAREFQGSIDEMIRESELDEVQRSIHHVSNFNLNDTVAHAIDPGGEIKSAMDTPVEAPPHADPEAHAVSPPLMTPSSHPAGPAPDPAEPAASPDPPIRPPAP